MRVELPDGGWAEIRTSKQLNVGQRRVMRAAATAALKGFAKLPDDFPTDPVEAAKFDMSKIDLTYEEAEAFDRFQEATVVAFIAAWSRSDPLPTMATISNLDVETYDALALATQKEGAALLTDKDFDPNPRDVPGNPTGNSVDSSGASKATEILSSTETSPTSTTSFASVV